MKLFAIRDMIMGALSKRKLIIGEFWKKSTLF